MRKANLCKKVQFGLGHLKERLYKVGSCPCCPATSSYIYMNCEAQQHLTVYKSLEIFIHSSTFTQWSKRKHCSHVMLLISYIFLQRLLFLCPQSAAECESGRRTQSSQSQEQQSVNHTSLPEGHSANEVIIRRQSKAERWHLSLATPTLSIMKSLYVSRNWSRMSVFSLQHKAQNRA